MLRLIYVILLITSMLLGNEHGIIAFHLQQWSLERATLLSYTHIRTRTKPCMETKPVGLHLSARVSVALCQRLNFYGIFHMIWRRSSSQKFVRKREFRENLFRATHTLLTTVNGLVRVERVLHDRFWRSCLQKAFFVMSPVTATFL
jgi:hypothetical protein